MSMFKDSRIGDSPFTPREIREAYGIRTESELTGILTALYGLLPNDEPGMKLLLLELEVCRLRATLNELLDKLGERQ